MSKKRRLEIVEERRPLREVSKAGILSSEVGHRSAGFLQNMRTTTRGHHARQNRDYRPSKTSKGQYFADLFSGEGKVSASVRRLGFAAREFDNRLSPEYDLTRKQLRKHLHSDIERGRMIAAMLAPPCESWTPARDRTSVIRNKQHPWGIPRQQLSDRDFEKVQVGNSTMQAAIEIVSHLHRMRMLMYV